MSTATLSSLSGSSTGSSIRRPSLPPWAPAATTIGAVLLTLLIFATTGFAGTADFIVVAVILSVLALGTASWVVEGRRQATNRVATAGALVALLLTLLPLGFVIGYVIKEGKARFGLSFLSHSAAGIGPFSPGGGVYHAIIGTVEQVLIASVIAVPLGLLVAIYISEYGGRGIGTVIRFLVDVMNGIPSIVAGLFILSFWIIALNRPDTGFAGSLALAILELPIIVRTSEEMIKLVPSSLREAAYALGVPKWKTILRIVLPTASTGMVTGVMLAVARVIGETAPVLLVIGNNDFINNNPFKGAQASLPVYIFQNAGSSSVFNVQRAWAGALALIGIVVILYVLARLLTRRNSLSRR